ncbi:MAG: phosphopantetheine adenylyltransferase [Pseudomonadota bacterium]
MLSGMRALIALCFVVPGFINLAPIVGLRGAGTLHRLYGVSAVSGDLALLLQHRAVLFGIIGGLLLAAAVQPNLRLAAALAGLVSMLSFTALAFSIEGVGAPLLRIAWIDVAASAALVRGLVPDYARVASSSPNVV